MNHKIKLIIYPSCPLMGIRYPDDDYKRETTVAKNYCKIGHIDIDKIGIQKASIIPTFNIPVYDAPIRAIYRGWMLSAERYLILFEYLKNKHNVLLINTPDQYSTMHYFPNAYKSVKDYTPLTIYSPVNDIDVLVNLSNEKFTHKPVFLKDYVKSESAYPEATFVEDGSDSDALKKAISKLIELRGDELNIGIVIKEKIDIAKTENNEDIEYRAFILNNELIRIYERFDKTYNKKQIDKSELEDLIFKVKDKLKDSSNFFTIDIILKKDGDFCLMEVGDGQVSGIPEYEKENIDFFYEKIFKKNKDINI